ncbi:MAG: heme exporter protein CcmB [Acidimicrobiia bacterium]|nr:heme exporter protein CcmB [Acidimicrobiia bacterium]
MSDRFWQQAFAVARRDLDRERRAGEVTWVMIPFGAIALLLVPLAIGINQDVLSRIGTGMLFVVVLLFGVLTAVRRTSIETPEQRDLIALLGIDPAAEFTGKTMASAFLLLVFQIAMGAVALVLYGLDISGWAWMIVVMPLTAVGLAELGTVSASVAASTNAGPALVPLLVTPLAIPLLLAATQTVESVDREGGNLTWPVLMAVVVLVLAIVGVATARPLQETR